MLREMLEEGVRQEIAWARYVIGDAVPGLTGDMVEGYIRYLGNLRWSSLGFGRLYEGCRDEPADMGWVSQYSNANMVKTDFFEAKSTAYAKSAALVDDLEDERRHPVPATPAGRTGRCPDARHTGA